MFARCHILYNMYSVHIHIVNCLRYCFITSYDVFLMWEMLFFIIFMSHLQPKFIHKYRLNASAFYRYLIWKNKYCSKPILMELVCKQCTQHEVISCLNHVYHFWTKIMHFKGSNSTRYVILKNAYCPLINQVYLNW